MYKNCFFLLTAAFLINSSIFTFNVSAKCLEAMDAFDVLPLKDTDIALIKKKSSDQIQNDIQKWESFFDSIQIGKTTVTQLNYRIVHLHNDVPWFYDKNIYGIDYRFSNTRAYYLKYRFFINEKTKLVGNKEKSFFVYIKSTRPVAGPVACKKPVIYFYPLKEQKVSVRLNYAGNITVSYPQYDPLIKGWNIKAYPDGKIIDMSDQEEYSYIFWEGSPTNVQYDMSEGFIVEGEKSEEFLRETLRKMGLKPREYNEFIVYWYPKLKNNKYNLIHFAHEEYEKIASLDITPKPDSLLRVFMVYKPLTAKIDIKPQEIKPFIRTGFTVVEWGGTEIYGSSPYSF